jgi:shikimate kinase
MRINCALNIILIGMPGAGKSTVGVLLAKRLGYNFIDTDLLLQSQQQCRLQQIIAREGLENFKTIEEQVLIELTTTHSVVATGGSAVYSERAMGRLRKLGQLVFIRKYAEVTIPGDEMTVEAVAAEIEKSVCGSTDE